MIFNYYIYRMVTEITIPSCVINLFHFSFDKACISFLISKGLSIGIVGLSCILKLPQILAMLKTKTIEGLSALSIYSEIMTFLFACLYPYHMKYPFVTYGENLTILIQNLMIFFLYWIYDKGKSNHNIHIFFLFLSIAITYICLTEIFMNNFAWYLVGSSGMILVSVSRFSQMYSSYSSKSTGPLSIFTFLLNILGNVARVFTTIKETNDYLLVASCIYGIFLSSIVVLQIRYYSKNNNIVKKSD